MVAATGRSEAYYTDYRGRPQEFVSAAQFGEGSFNKGIFIQIPFDALMPWSSPIQARMEWVPLTRDGGAMLNRPLQLYQQTMLMSPARRAQKPASE